MIRLLDVTLDPESRAQLDAWQRELDAVSPYPDRVDAGKERFKQRNVASNPTFRHVRASLRKMGHGAARCAYCEHSTGDEVEHLWPKDFYPGRVFDWHNYLHACGTCNGCKLNHWRLRVAGGALLTLARTRAEREARSYGPPPEGDPLFIDPREEDPMRLLRVDLVDTFHVVPRPGLDAWDDARAAWTVERLELNEREDLVEARANCFHAYVDRLEQYIAKRDGGADLAALAFRVAAIQRMDHPMVWREMQRSHSHLPELAALFAQAPEALGW